MKIHIVLYGNNHSLVHRMRGSKDEVGAKSVVQGLMMSPHEGNWDVGDMPVTIDHPLIPTTLVKRWVKGPRWIELHEMEVE